MARFFLDKGSYFIGDLSTLLPKDVWDVISLFKYKTVHSLNGYKLIKFDVSDSTVINAETGSVLFESGVFGIAHIDCAENKDAISDHQVFDSPINFIVENKKKSFLLNDKMLKLEIISNTNKEED